MSASPGVTPYPVAARPPGRVPCPRLAGQGTRVQLRGEEGSDSEGSEIGTSFEGEPVLTEPLFSSMSFLNRGDRKVEVKRVVAEQDEAMFPVKLLRLFVDGIHFDRVDAEDCRQLQTSLQGIDKQGITQSLPLDTLVHRQSCQQDRRDRMTREIACGVIGEVLNRDNPRSQCVIAVNPLLVPAHCDIGPTESPLLVLTGQRRRKSSSGTRPQRNSALVSLLQPFDPPIIHHV